MDIFVIKTSEINEIDQNILKEFQKKEISNQETLKTHCFTYLMLDKILKNVYKIDNCEIIFENKKPKLKSNEKHFSISHSKEYIAIAFSDFNCGVDIEKIKNRDFEKISNRMNFNAKTLQEFYQEWTRFEAEYKLNCKSLSSKHFQIEDYSLTAVSENPEEKYEIYFANKE